MRDSLAIGVQGSMRTLDLFSGAGGSSWGAQRAGATIVAGIDSDERATQAYHTNFPNAKAICGRLEGLDPVRVKREVGAIDLLLASPECTNHSPAKGAAPRCELSKRTALEVVRFADTFKPLFVVIENVVNMRRWSRYDEMLADLRALDYSVQTHILNAAHFGVPQSRRRLFIVCSRATEPPQIAFKKRDSKPAKRVVKLDDTYRWTPLRRTGRAKDTLARADRAIDALGDGSPFLIVYYGSDGAGGWQRLNRPLRTITTLDRFALVRPSPQGHMMRMLQVPELKAAMGMPVKFVAGLGTRRDQIRAIGNAVCPPVMRQVVQSLVQGSSSRLPQSNYTAQHE